MRAIELSPLYGSGFVERQQLVRFLASALVAPRATRGSRHETATAGVREEPPQSARASRRGGAGAGGPSRVRRVPRRVARASVAHRRSHIGNDRVVVSVRRLWRGSHRFGARVAPRLPRARVLLKARRRRRRRRLERRRARARPRVGDPRGKKVCQRGTYPTRIPPAVRARWRSKPPTRPPRTPRSRAARRRWRRYARADSRTKTPTSPRPEPRDARRARLEGENLVSVVSGPEPRLARVEPTRVSKPAFFGVRFLRDIMRANVSTHLSVTPPHLQRVTSERDVTTSDLSRYLYRRYTSPTTAWARPWASVRSAR